VTLRVVEHAERSDTGEVRPANEDSFLVRAPLFVVADGMGGANAGEVASRAAVETFAAGLPQADGVGARLAEAVRAANRRINQESTADSSRRGMGTTVTAALVGDGDVTLAHVGDSRAYLVRGAKICQLTQDHTLVDELVRQGQLTEAEAAVHPQRSIITRALGPEPSVEVDVTTHQVEADDVLLLCSDGLTGMVGDEQIFEIVTSAQSLAAASKALVDAANAAGGRDNITVLLARVGEGGAKLAAPLARKPVVGGAASLSQPGSKRSKKGLVSLVALVAVVFVLLAAGWQAAQAVFFLGTDSQGTVTVYRGLPYELPLGIDLYKKWYISGVPAASIPPAERSRLLDHRFRSKRDAADLIASLERGDLNK
jgi:protein phosphatase